LAPALAAEFALMVLIRAGTAAADEDAVARANIWCVLAGAPHATGAPASRSWPENELSLPRSSSTARTSHPIRESGIGLWTSSGSRGDFRLLPVPAGPRVAKPHDRRCGQTVAARSPWRSKPAATSRGARGECRARRAQQMRPSSRKAVRAGQRLSMILPHSTSRKLGRLKRLAQ